jgi:hypothetical protein
LAIDSGLNAGHFDHFLLFGHFVLRLVVCCVLFIYVNTVNMPQSKNIIKIFQSSQTLQRRGF